MEIMAPSKRATFSTITEHHRLGTHLTTRRQSQLTQLNAEFDKSKSIPRQSASGLGGLADSK